MDWVSGRVVPRQQEKNGPRSETRSRSRVKWIAQFQRNVPTRPRSRSIVICRGKDGMRYVTVISGARETKREKEWEREMKGESRLDEEWEEDLENVRGSNLGWSFPICQDRMHRSPVARPSRSGLPGANGSREINSARYWRSSQKVKPFNRWRHRERESHYKRTRHYVYTP